MGGRDITHQNYYEDHEPKSQTGNLIGLALAGQYLSNEEILFV